MVVKGANMISVCNSGMKFTRRLYSLRGRVKEETATAWMNE